MENHDSSFENTFDQLRQLLNNLQFVKEYTGFLQELLQLIEKIHPVLENLFRDIEESTISMPDVSHKLRDANNLTEKMVNNILDITERMSEELSQMMLEIGKLKDSLPLSRWIALLRRVKNDHPDETILDEIIAFFCSLRDGQSISLFGQYLSSLEKIQQDVNRIMIEMQIQDVTSQQLGSANYALLQIYLRLRKVLLHVANHPVELSIPMDDDHINHDAGKGDVQKQQALADQLTQLLSPKKQRT